jgi:hypothetical protein
MNTGKIYYRMAADWTTVVGDGYVDGTSVLENSWETIPGMWIIMGMEYLINCIVKQKNR